MSTPRLSTPRLVSSASFFAIARLRIHNQSINTSSISTIHDQTHRAYQKFTNEDDHSSVASSTPRSEYLSTLHLSTSIDSSDGGTEDDPNDTKIYQSLDRRSSYNPPPPPPPPQVTTSASRSFRSHRPATRTAAAAAAAAAVGTGTSMHTTSQQQALKRKTVKKLKKSRQPVIANATHKCICMSTKVRERLTTFQMQSKKDAAELSKEKKKRKKYSTQMKQLKKIVKAEELKFQTCRARLLIGVVQALRRRLTRRALYRWERNARDLKNMTTGSNYLKRLCKKLNKTKMKRAMSSWRGAMLHYTSMQLLDCTELLEDERKEKTRLQHISSEATANVLKLQSFLNDIVSSGRKERKEKKIQAIKKTMTKLQRCWKKRGLFRWKDQVQRCRVIKNRAAKKCKTLLANVFESWYLQTIQSLRLTNLLIKSFITKNIQRKRSSYATWSENTKFKLRTRKEEERKWTAARRVCLSRGWQIRIALREKQRWCFQKWMKVKNLDERRERKLVHLEKRQIKKLIEWRWKKWQKFIVQEKEVETRQHWIDRCLVRTRKRRTNLQIIQCFQSWSEFVSHQKKVKKKTNSMLERFGRQLTAWTIQQWRRNCLQLISNKNSRLNALHQWNEILCQKQLRLAIECLRRNVKDARLERMFQKYIRSIHGQTLRKCHGRWLIFVRRRVRQRARCVYYLRRCRKEEMKSRFHLWSRSAKLLRSERRQVERDRGVTKLRGKMIVEKLLLKKLHRNNQWKDSSLQRSFQIWRTDVLLMEGLEAMNDISGHLKAAALVRLYLTRVSLALLTQGWLRWRLAYQAEAVQEEHQSTMAQVHFKYVIELGKKVCGAWREFVKERKYLRRLIVRRLGTSFTSSVAVRRVFHTWRYRTRLDIDRCTLTVRNILKHGMWRVQRLRMLRGWKIWQEHDTSLQRMEAATALMFRYHARRDGIVMKSCVQKWLQFVRSRRRRALWLKRQGIKKKRTLSELALQRWRSKVITMKRREKCASMLFCKVRAWRLTTALQWWSTWSKIVCIVDKLQYQVNRTSLQGYISKWKKYIERRRKGKRALNLTIQRRCRTNESTKMNRYWRRWWEQVHGGCLAVLEKEHQTERQRERSNYNQSMEYQRSEHMKVMGMHEETKKILETTKQHHIVEMESLTLNMNQVVSDVEEQWRQEMVCVEEEKESNRKKEHQEQCEKMERIKMEKEKIIQAHYFQCQTLMSTMESERETHALKNEEQEVDMLLLKKEHETSIQSMRATIQQGEKMISHMKSEGGESMIAQETLKMKLVACQREYEEQLSQWSFVKKKLTREVFERQEENLNAMKLVKKESENQVQELETMLSTASVTSKETTQKYEVLHEAKMKEMKELCELKVKKISEKHQAECQGLKDTQERQQQEWDTFQQDMEATKEQMQEDQKELTKISTAELAKTMGQQKRESQEIVVNLTRWKGAFYMIKKRVRQKLCMIQCFNIWRETVQSQNHHRIMVMLLINVVFRAVTASGKRQLTNAMRKWSKLNAREQKVSSLLHHILKRHIVERKQRMALEKWKKCMVSTQSLDQDKLIAIAVSVLRAAKVHAIQSSLSSAWKEWKNVFVVAARQRERSRVDSLLVIDSMLKRQVLRQLPVAFSKWKVAFLVARQADDFEKELELREQKHTEDQFPWSMWTRVSESLNLLLPSCNPVSGCAFAGNIVLAAESSRNKENKRLQRQLDRPLGRPLGRPLDHHSSRSHQEEEEISHDEYYDAAAAGIVDVRSQKYGADYTPIDSSCTCYTCQRYTRSYLHHLFRAQRTTCQHMISLHNMHYTCRVIARLCGEDEHLAEKIRVSFPLAQPDLSQRVLHPHHPIGRHDSEEEESVESLVEDWQYPLVTPECTPGRRGVRVVRR